MCYENVYILKSREITTHSFIENVILYVEGHILPYEFETQSFQTWQDREFGGLLAIPVMNVKLLCFVIYLLLRPLVWKWNVPNSIYVK